MSSDLGRRSRMRQSMSAKFLSSFCRMIRVSSRTLKFMNRLSGQRTLLNWFLLRPNYVISFDQLQQITHCNNSNMSSLWIRHVRSKRSVVHCLAHSDLGDPSGSVGSVTHYLGASMTYKLNVHTFVKLLVTFGVNISFQAYESVMSPPSVYLFLQGEYFQQPLVLRQHDQCSLGIHVADVPECSLLF